MSGVKEATVVDSLDRTLDTVRDMIRRQRQNSITKYLDTVERAADAARKEVDAKRTNVSRLKPTRELRSDLKPFLAGETAQWENLLKRYDKTLENAEDLYNDASDKIRDYNARKKAAEDSIDLILDQARALSVLNDLKRNSSLCTKAQDLSQKSFAAFSEAENLVRLAQQEYDRLVNLGEERKKQQKIQEENQRKAVLLAHEIRSLRNAIESKNYAKFGSGVYSAAEQQKIANIEALVAAGKYEQALSVAPGLKRQLEEAVRTIAEKQLAWETAKVAAEKALIDARKEVAGFNRAEMNDYSGESEAVIQASFNAIETAAGLIRAEDFTAASSLIGNSLQRIRAIAEKTMENKAAAERRIEVAQCIMAALEASKYDEPQAYMEEDDNSLSDLCIVAAAPGGIADMTMRIDLNGTVDFVVENIPEGQEQLCEAAVKQLQENMGEDFRFEVTDWGRAGKDHPQHLDLPPAQERTKQLTKDKRRS